jgi:hypothetical protein
VTADADKTRDQSDRPEDSFLAEFRTAAEGTDLHAQVRAAAKRAAKRLGVEERLAAKLPPARTKPSPD